MFVQTYSRSLSKDNDILVEEGNDVETYFSLHMYEEVISREANMMATMRAGKR